VIGIPEIDYESHPAYGKTFGEKHAATALRAIRRLTPKLARLAVRYAIDHVRQAFAPSAAGLESLSAVSRHHLTTLKRDGVILTGFSEEDRRALVAAAEPYFARLQDRLDTIPLVDRRFHDCQLVLRPAHGPALRRGAIKQLSKRGVFFTPFVEAPEVFACVERGLTNSGILDAASVYRGRQLRVEILALQINEAGEPFLRHHFRDLGADDPASTYMHVDTQLRIIKGIFYMDPVGPANGPFCYVPGTQEPHRSLAETITRGACDMSGLSRRDREDRELFWSLPRPLQRKADFGTDLGDDDARTLLERETKFLSGPGRDLVVFDNDGIHRGALIDEGRRRILQIQLR
jgi:hypothetical protein